MLLSWLTQSHESSSHALGFAINSEHFLSAMQASSELISVESESGCCGKPPVETQSVYTETQHWQF